MIILTDTPGEHCVSVHVSTGVLGVRAGARAHQAGSDSAHLRDSLTCTLALSEERWLFSEFMMLP